MAASALAALSRQGRWDDITGLISNEILQSIAVVGERHEIAAKLTARLDGIADSVSLTHNRSPDPQYGPATPSLSCNNNKHNVDC